MTQCPTKPEIDIPRVVWYGVLEGGNQTMATTNPIRIDPLPIPVVVPIARRKLLPLSLVRLAYQVYQKLLGFVVASDDDFRFGAERLRDLTTVLQRVEDRRKEAKAPYLKAAADVDDAVGRVTKELTTAKAALVETLSGWATDHPDAKSAYTKTTPAWSWTVVDEAVVPAEFFVRQVDPKLVEAALKAGRTISGVSAHLLRKVSAK